jgi:hypothetical protein
VVPVAMTGVLFVSSVVKLLGESAFKFVTDMAQVSLFVPLNHNSPRY